MDQLNKQSSTAKRATFGSDQREQSVESDEAQVFAVVEGINAAFRAKDLDKIMSYYADDIVAFDMMPPLEFNSKDAYRKAWQMGLDGMSEVGPFEDAHRKIRVSGDLAVMHCLCHMQGTLKKDNQKMDTWSRYTGVFKKTNGKWLIVHEQFSVPIDMESEKAIWTLKPETEMMH